MTRELGFEGWVEFHQPVRGQAVAQEVGATWQKKKKTKNQEVDASGLAF